jgi:hypothetical protein
MIHQNMISKLHGLMVCQLFLVLIVGCQKSHLPGPSGTVQGKAAYKGAAIPVGSTVILYHDREGLIGTGLTDEAGKFQVKMNGANDVLVGDYTVYIKPPGDPDENVLEYTKATVPPEWNKIPKAYWSASTTKARYSVKEGKNDFDFTLVD